MGGASRLAHRAMDSSGMPRGATGWGALQSRLGMASVDVLLRGARAAIIELRGALPPLQ